MTFSFWGDGKDWSNPSADPVADIKKAFDAIVRNEAGKKNMIVVSMSVHRRILRFEQWLKIRSFRKRKPFNGPIIGKGVK